MFSRLSDLCINFRSVISSLLHVNATMLFSQKTFCSFLKYHTHNTCMLVIPSFKFFKLYYRQLTPTCWFICMEVGCGSMVEPKQDTSDITAVSQVPGQENGTLLNSTNSITGNKSFA